MSEKFQIVESTDNGLNHTASDLPFNRNDRIDNLIHWIYQNVELQSGESVEHDLMNRKIKIYKKLDDGTNQIILEGFFNSPEGNCCNGERTCCKSTN